METKYFDQLQTPIIITEAQGQMIYYNHICPTYFKLPPRKLNKIASIFELLQTDYDLANTIKSCLESDSAQITSEIEINTPENPTPYTVIIKAIPIGGKVILNIWDFSIEKQLFDKYKKQINELKDTHNQILMSDKLTAIGELTAGIGHEIANPLTIIGARLEELSESINEANISDIKSHTQAIKNGFERIGKIINNLNSFLEDKDEDLTICSFTKVINDSLKFISELEISRNIDIKVSSKSDSLFMGSELKLQQVVINLIKNSIDALRNNSTTSPQIIIELMENENTQSTILKIRDNGPGVPEEEMDKIFEMFYTTKELGEGTGLGLAISQKIVESHHGTLSYIAEDLGACFQIDLPFVEIESFSATSRYITGEVSFEDNKLLVLGDDPEVLTSLLSKLKEKNIVMIVSHRVLPR